MSPELVRSGHYGLPADVYSFGVLLVDLFGEQPYSQPEYRDLGIAQLLYAVVTEGLRPVLPAIGLPRLNDLIIECLEAEPEHRPSFAELVTRLRRIDIKLEEHSSGVLAMRSPSSSLASSNTSGISIFARLGSPNAKPTKRSSSSALSPSATASSSAAHSSDVHIRASGNRSNRHNHSDHHHNHSSSSNRNRNNASGGSRVSEPEPAGHRVLPASAQVVVPRVPSPAAMAALAFDEPGTSVPSDGTRRGDRLHEDGVGLLSANQLADDDDRSPSMAGFDTLGHASVELGHVSDPSQFSRHL
jgi:Protein tyrosine and serine/threonine kinase